MTSQMRAIGLVALAGTILGIGCATWRVATRQAPSGHVVEIGAPPPSVPLAPHAQIGLTKPPPPSADQRAWHLQTSQLLATERHYCGKPTPVVLCDRDICVAREDLAPTVGVVLNVWGTMIPDLAFSALRIDDDLSGCQRATHLAPRAALMGQNGAMPYLACRAFLRNNAEKDTVATQTAVARMCNAAAQVASGADKGAYVAPTELGQ